MPLSATPRRQPATRGPSVVQPPPELSRKARGLIARIRRDSNDIEAVSELEAHYAEVGDHGSLANLLAGWAEILLDGRRAADALMRGADAILIGVGDRERACMFLEHALTRCPAHEGALHQLTQLLTQAKDHERLRMCMRRVAADLEGELEHAAYQATIEYRLGKLCEDVFEQPGKAVLRYRRAIELAPTMLPAIIAARRLYIDAGDFDAVASLYEFEIQATTADDDKVGLLVELARCQHGRLGDHEQAVRALRKALQLTPHSAALMIELAEVLDDRRSSSAAHPSDERRAAELFYQAARLVPESEAASLLDSALALDPTHAGATRWRAQLAGQAAPAPTHEPTPQPAQEPAPEPTAELAPALADPLSAPLPPRPSNAPPRRSTPPPPPPEASSILPPPPAGPDAMSAAPTPAIPDVATPVAPPARAAALDDEPGEDEATRLSPLPPAPQPDAHVQPQPLSSAPPPAPTDGEDAATRISAPFPLPADFPGMEPQPEQARHDVDEWLATPASDTHPLDTQGLRPIDGSRLSDAPPPPTSTPPLRSAATGPVRPAPASTKNLMDKMSRLKDRLKRRSSVAPAGRGAAEAAPAVTVPPAARVPTIAEPAPAVVAPATPAHAPEPTIEPSASADAYFEDAAGESSKLVDILPSDGQRVEMEANLGPSTESNFYSGFDGTLANGGVFVATYDTVAVDTAVVLTLTFPGGYIAEAHGRVRFVRDVFDFDAHADPGVGVQFEAMTRESLELIERFAQKRPPIFFD